MTAFENITAQTALLIIIGIVVFFVLVIWSIRRHRDPVLRVECDASIDKLLPRSRAYPQYRDGGNSVEVLENGAFFDVLIDEIAAAKRSVHLEHFFGKTACWAGASPTRFRHGPAQA